MGVLGIGAMDPDLERGLDERFETHWLHRVPDGERARLLDTVGPRILAVVTSSRIGLTAGVIDRLPALRGVSSYSAGVDGIDVAALRRRGVPIGTTADLLPEEVANLAVALALAVTREVVANDRYLRGGGWARQGPWRLSRSVIGRRAGIVGLGRIGAAVARRMEALGCAIAYHGRRRRAEVAYDWHPDAASLAAASDLLFVACPGGPETRHIVDAPVLAALGRDGFLVNVARGSCVDQAALVSALEAGTIAGAGLDVFQGEPAVPEALCRMDNVVLQTHAGSATVETRRAMAGRALENVRRVLAGEPMLGLAD